jgi:hypothetical protein
MRKTVQPAPLFLAIAMTATGLRAEDAPSLRIWNDPPRFMCPFEQSPDYSAIGFTGRIWSGGNADTFYPSWGRDGHLYSCFTDGSVDGVRVGSRSKGGEPCQIGYLTIKGDRPDSLRFEGHGVLSHDAGPYRGRYPSACLVHDDNWFLGSYSLDDLPMSNYGTLGPFVGFHVSRDLGKTWELCPHSPEKPLFGESGKAGGSVKIGAPHFVDFGQNMEHSPDGKAYLVAHGSTLPDAQPRHANNSWITGDQVFLVRVDPQPDRINDVSAYEFFAGRDEEGKDVWSGDFGKIKPIAEWNNNMGCVTITYNTPLKKYLMCVTDGQTTWSRYNSYILESDRITGPWRMLAYMKDFGEMAYFLNIPSKFISKDGMTMWLCYSTNWINVWQNRQVYDYDPKGGGYSMTLAEIRLLRPAASGKQPGG